MGGSTVLKVSDELYASFTSADFYNFLFDFLKEEAQGPAFRVALDDRAVCERVWQGMFDADCDEMELALRHAHALGAMLAGAAQTPFAAEPARMKADLDNWGFLAFSTFDLEPE